MWLIFLAALLTSWRTPVLAQAPDPAPEMTIELAWEGSIRQTGWTEARVTLRNDNADWQGDVVVIDERNEVTYHLPVELPARSFKQYRIPLFVKDGVMLAMALRDDGGLRHEQTVVLHSMFDNSRVVVMADARGPVIVALAAQDSRIWLDTLHGLPETPMAWDTVDVLILNGIPTADLTGAQREALLAWVGAGGHLIVGGGPSLAQTLNDLPEPLRVATAGDVRIVNQVHLIVAQLTNVAVTTLVPKEPASTLAAVSGSAVAVRGLVGKGKVDIAGWDLAQPGGEAWLIALWENDQIPAISSPLTNVATSGGAPSSYDMLRIPIDTLPTLWMWLLLFPVYLFVMGPGTLIVVRRLRRPVLAWVLLPAWIVLAIVALAFGLSSTFSRTFPLIRENALVIVPGNGLPARAVQGTAVYAPRIRNLSWTTGGAPRPLYGIHRFDNWYNEGEPFPVDARYVDGGSTMQAGNPLGVITWGSEGLFVAPDFSADLALTSHDGQLYIDGSITGEMALRDVTLLIDDAQYAITLTNAAPAGIPVNLSRPVTATSATRYNYQGGICGRSDYYNPYGAMMPTVMSSKVNARSTNCYVTGVVDTVPFTTTGAGGTRIGESCLIYSIPCPAQPAGPLATTLEIDQERIVSGWAEVEHNVINGYGPQTIVYYDLPAYLRVDQVEHITVEVQNAPGAKVTSAITDIESISVWNWVTESWQPYTPSEMPIVLTGSDAVDVFDPTEGVRVRVISTDDGFAVRMVVTLEGTR